MEKISDKIDCYIFGGKNCMQLKITSMNLHVFMNSTTKFRLANVSPFLFYEGSKFELSWS